MLSYLPKLNQTLEYMAIGSQTSVSQNHLEGLLKNTLVGLPPTVSDSVGFRVEPSNWHYRVLGDAMLCVCGHTLENHQTRHMYKLCVSPQLNYNFKAIGIENTNNVLFSSRILGF